MKTLTLLVIVLSSFLLNVSANYGSDFYVGVMRNYRGETSAFLLYITTTSVTPVSYTVETNTGVFTTGNVTSTVPVMVNIPISLVTNNGLYSSRFNGVHVNSTSIGSLSVLVVNTGSSTFGDYLAYPVQDFQQNQYQYYAVSTDTLATGENSLSEVLLVGNRDNTTVTVVPTQSMTVPQDIQDPNSVSRTITAGNPFTFTIHRMQTFLIGAPILDISGTSIVSSEPLTVVSGHECGNIPLVCCCQQLAEQIPPTVTWGKQFLLTPYATRPGPYFKIVASESKTTLTFTCSTSQGVYNNVTYLDLAGDLTLRNSSTGIYCFIDSDKPILVTQFGPSQGAGIGLGDPVMSLIPPLEQHDLRITFVVPYFPSIVSTYLNIATVKKGSVFLNNQSIQITWNNIYDSSGNIAGYGGQISLNSSLALKSYTITMQSPFSALVYGFGDYHGYSYSAGVNINQLVTNPLQVRPWYGNLLGGVPILVSGPSWKENDEIALYFDDVKVNCSRVNKLDALCVTPFLTKAGKVNVQLYHNTYLFEKSTTYYSVPFESDAKVSVQSTNKFFTSEEKVDISWTPASLSDEPTSKVDICMYEIQEKSDGTFMHKEVAVLASDIPNNGEATVTIPASLTGSTATVCTVNILVQVKNIISNSLSVVTNKIGQWTDSLWVSITNSLDNALNQQCIEWAANEPASIGTTLLDSVTSSTPCPPNSRQAAAENSGLVKDTNNLLIAFFHPLASSCFRQRVATSIGAGNQCCYRSDGTLIVGPPSGGSVDKVAPTGNGLKYLSNVFAHFREDVLPYIYCCKGGKPDCSKYYERRPSDDGSSFNPPVPACVYGDPHIVTLDLHKYTFNGKGEYTLIETGNKWFTLQGRMIEASDLNGANARGTVFSAIAAKQLNSDTVQFEVKEDGVLVCLVDKDEVDFSVLLTQEFDNVSVSDLGNSTFSASFSNRAFVKVQETNGFISVLIVSLPDNFRGQTRGLMGNYNGNMSDDLLPRGGAGSPIPLNSSLQVIHEDFGVTWIVNDSDSSLFTYQFTKSWTTFYYPSFTPVYGAAFADAILEEKANEICGNDEFCKFDIAATGRVEIGEATFNGGQNFEQLVNLSQQITCDPPCMHGACVATDVCVCGEGYSGDTCDSIVTIPCSNNPCNGGACQYHAGNYICTCPPALTGMFCEDNIPSSTPAASQSVTSISTAPTASALPTPTDEHNDILFVYLIGGVVAGVFLLLVIVMIVSSIILLVVCLRKKKSKRDKRNEGTIYKVMDKHEMAKFEDEPGQATDIDEFAHIYDSMAENDQATRYKF